MTRRAGLLILTLFGVVVALAAAVPLTARALEPSFGTPVPQLAAFTPWALPLVVLAAALLLAGRRRRGAITVLVVAGLVLAVGVRWQIPPSAARATADRIGGTPLTLMTVNVEYGGADAAAVLALVGSYQVDVLVVEEMTPAFADRLGLAGIDAVLPHADLHPQEGPAGTGIWSRRELTADGVLPGTDFVMPQVTIALPEGASVAVTGVHTRAPKSAAVPDWRQDLGTVADAVVRNRAGGPQIYTGDFNASRDHSGFRAVMAAGLVDAADATFGPGFTWPADQPGPAATRIDHVLVTPSTIGVRKVTVVNVAGTDHHGVVADLMIAPRPR